MSTEETEASQAKCSFRIGFNEQYIKTKVETVSEISAYGVDEINDYFDSHYSVLLTLIDGVDTLLYDSIDSKITMYKKIIISESVGIVSKLRSEAENLKIIARNKCTVKYENKEYHYVDIIKEIVGEIDFAVTWVQKSFVGLTKTLENDLVNLSSVLTRRVKINKKNMNSMFNLSKTSIKSQIVEVTDSFLVESDKLEESLAPKMAQQEFQNKLIETKEFVDKYVVDTWCNQKDKIFSEFCGLQREFTKMIGKFLTNQAVEMSKNLITKRLRSCYDIVLMETNNMQLTVDRMLSKLQGQRVSTEVENSTVTEDAMLNEEEYGGPSSRTNNQEVTAGRLSNLDQFGPMFVGMDAQQVAAGNILNVEHDDGLSAGTSNQEVTEDRISNLDQTDTISVEIDTQ